jgi:predicted nucleic acid-binding protein
MLVDTSAFVDLLQVGSARSDRARAAFAAASRRVTHSLVIAETVQLATIRGIPRARTLNWLRMILEDRTIHLHWTDQSMIRRAGDLLFKRADKTYSLCDAVSFVLMRDLRIEEAMSSDRHFIQEGFRLA